MIEQDYLAHREEIVNRIRKIIGDDAEDIVQEAFVKFLQTEGIKQPRAWLFNTARKLAFNYSRDRRHAARIVNPVAFTALRAKDPKPEIPSLDDTIKQLSPDDGELLRLIHWEGLSQVAISKRLGLPYERIKKRTLRATKRLKTILKKSHFSCPA